MESGFPPPVRALKLVAPPAPAPPRCLNCDGELGGKFCQECGQPAKVKRFTFHDFLHEVPHALLHFDHALPRTLKGILTRPGATIRAYLEGKRAHVYSPISLFFMMAGLAVLAGVVSGGSEHAVAQGKALVASGAEDLGLRAHDLVGGVTKMTSFMRAKQAYLDIIFLPANAVIPWLVLRKRTGLGLAEQVITAAMIGTGMAALSLVFLPAVLLAKSHPGVLAWVRFAGFPVVYGYATWAYADLQRKGEEGGATRVARYGRGLLAAIGVKLGALFVFLAVGLSLMTTGMMLQALASVIPE